LKRLILKPDPDTRFAQFGRSDIKLKRAEPNVRCWTAALAAVTLRFQIWAVPLTPVLE
jgi:hypothetical protein